MVFVIVRISGLPLNLFPFSVDNGFPHFSSLFELPFKVEKPCAVHARFLTANLLPFPGGKARLAEVFEQRFRSVFGGSAALFEPGRVEGFFSLERRCPPAE